MGIQLKVRNFRSLRNVDWSPDGVCVLVGPNGAGKTTLFDALNFLRLSYELNLPQAIDTSGGRFFRNLDAPPEEGIGFVLSQGTFTWDLNLSFGAGPFGYSIGEQLSDGPEAVFVRRQGQNSFNYRGRTAAIPPDMATFRVAKDMAVGQPLPAIFPLVKSFLVYGSYALQQLRQSGSPHSSDMQLSPNGLNAFAVLRNWRDKRDYRPAYNFVLDKVCNAFPGVSDELEFDSAGQITSLRLVNALRAESIPVTFAPNGWLAGLLHLMAVAGAAPGGVVMIDEFENSLHPYAIRSLVNAMRDWAAKKELTVILAGHSPALLDEFHEDPFRVFVMEPWHAGQSAMPRRLTDYREPEWLKHFSLGELYRHEDFGGPKNGQVDSVPALSGSEE
jgi:energy-coupling factor transporter ATP-binding protein EcfA2